MRVTTKGRYALRAALALARLCAERTPVSIKTISQSEGISPEFLEQIFFRLRKAGLIASVRGPGGGFYFAKPLPEISLLDVLEASGEGLGIAPCICGKDAQCGRKKTCIASGVWHELDDTMREFASKRSLAEMLA